MLVRRVRQHTRGEGAKLTAAVVRAGGELHVAAVWLGLRSLEHELKNRKNAPCFCPICTHLRSAKKAAALGQAHFLDLTIEDAEVPF